MSTYTTSLRAYTCADCAQPLQLAIEQCRGPKDRLLPLCAPCLAARVAAVEAQPDRPRWQRALKGR